MGLRGLSSWHAGSHHVAQHHHSLPRQLFMLWELGGAGSQLAKSADDDVGVQEMQTHREMACARGYAVPVVVDLCISAQSRRTGRPAFQPSSCHPTLDATPGSM